MDVAKLLDQLRKELAYLDAAILSLEQLQAGEQRRAYTPRVRTGRLKAEPKPLPDGSGKSHHRHSTE